MAKQSTLILLLLVVATLVVAIWGASQPYSEEMNRAHLAPISALEFSPDGLLLASASLDSSIKLWNVSDGTQAGTLNRQDDHNLCVAVAPDGSMIATGTEDHLVRIWHIDGRLVRTLVGHTGAVHAIAFSSDGTHLVSAGDDQTIRMWNATNGKRVHSWKAHDSPIRSVAFAPGGNLIASGGADRVVRIWSILSGFSIHAETLRVDDVRAVAFSPDGTILASSGLDETGRPVVRLWDVTSGLLLHTIIGHTGAIHSVAFSPQGELLALAGADKVISLFKLERFVHLIKKAWLLRELEGHSDEVRSLAFFADARHLLSGSLDGTIKVWNVENGSPVQSVDWPQAPVTAVAIFPDGTRFAGASYGSMDGASLRVWKRESDRPLQSYSLRVDRVYTVSFSPDGHRLAASGDDNRIRFWDLSSRALVQLLARQEHPTHLLTYSPDGQWLASASEAGAVKLWWTSDGRELRTLSDGPERVARLRFSADGNVVMAEGSETVRSWKPASGELLSQMTLTPERRTPALADARGGELIATAPDGRMFATADEQFRIQLWGLPEKHLLHTLTDVSALNLLVRATVLPVFRLERARLGAVRLIASRRCGDDGDGRCITSDTFLVLRFQTKGRFLKLETSKAQVSASRREILRGIFNTPEADAIGIRLKKGFDLTAGEEICISGIRVSASPEIFGEGRHLDWRFDQRSNRWELREFVLLMDVYPELHGEIKVFVSSLPKADVSLPGDGVIVAHPLKELQ